MDVAGHGGARERPARFDALCTMGMSQFPEVSGTPLTVHLRPTIAAHRNVPGVPVKSLDASSWKPGK